MKKLHICLTLVAALVAAFLTTTAVFGQKIPEGPYSAEPGYLASGTNVTQLCVRWHSGETMFADFDDNDIIAAISFYPGYGDASYVEGGDVSKFSMKFTNAAVWTKFAQNIRAQFQIIDGDTYVETVPYEFLGKSVILETFEAPLRNQALVFKSDARLLSVPLMEWKGEVPTKVGEKVYIGRTNNQGHFFPATKAGQKFLIDVATARQIAEPKKPKADF